ncbi:ribosomal protein L11 methyltransferase [Oikeobacillus pervagus]|uniref:Ribosomal protein L11 methyltransferase n=1 Tax=Oikeobacillus pervagus TaxID=1325931 RepID=A0AAJ1WJA4_9BACI|nr:50S ribosomal protein L11 methyltransferase [Oikeobacillus pervagus]MDQ0213931.1 ribosomal protein L11 methyltransferase [Oikeobacillus pervagus]
MKWSEISILTTNEAVEAISNILHDAGASGVVIEDPLELEKVRENQFGEIYQLDPNDYPSEGVMIKAYLPLNSFIGETVEEIKQSIHNLASFNIDVGKNEISINEVHEEEWATAWKKYFHPVKVSSKFTIVPTWEDYQPINSDELIIELDPGMAFGTGTHPTTVMCLQALERTVREGDHVVDVGTGSGVLSIGAALLGARQVTALDLDPVAVESAKSNIRLNKVEANISVSLNNLLDGIQEKVDIVVSNILAEVIVSFTGDVAKAVKQNGYFIASGIIKQKQDQVKSAIESVGFEITETIAMEDWIAIIAKIK